MGTIQVLEDIENAFENYPHEYLTLEIIDVHIPPETPNAVIDVNDDCLFRIRVTNRGPLNIDELSLLVEGLNGTEVKSNGANSQWVDSFTISAAYVSSTVGIIYGHSGDAPVEIPGPGPDDTHFHFIPRRVSESVEKELVRVSVANYRADFKHMFDSHTDADPAAQDTYSSTVSPT